MRRIKMAGAAAVLAAAVAGAIVGAGTPEILLLDAPRGAWLARLRGDAPLVVLEERDGWRRIRLEGWIPPAGPEGAAPPAGAVPPAAPAAPVAAPPAAVTAPPAAGTHAPAAVPATQAAPPTAIPGATISGVLIAPPGQESAGPGAGLLVLLAGDLDRLDAEHRRAGEECREKLAQDDARLAEIETVLKKALNSSDNFQTAAGRYDRAKADKASAQKGRSADLAACRERADALFQEHAVARAITDGLGRFELPGVSPGRYRVVATDRGQPDPRTWSIDCRVDGSLPIVLDPRSGRGPDPYWNLR
jgi:hypothetical protein